MLGSLMLYLKSMRIMMFQLSGFYYKPLDSLLKGPQNPDPREDPTSRSLNGGSYEVPLVV